MKWSGVQSRREAKEMERPCHYAASRNLHLDVHRRCITNRANLLVQYIDINMIAGKSVAMEHLNSAFCINQHCPALLKCVCWPPRPSLLVPFRQALNDLPDDRSGQCIARCLPHLKRCVSPTRRVCEQVGCPTDLVDEVGGVCGRAIADEYHCDRAAVAETRG